MFDLQALAPVAAFTVTLLLLAVFRRIGLFTRIQDFPNRRSLHTQPIPRIGGIALMIGAFGAYTMLVRHPLWSIVVPVLLLTASPSPTMFGIFRRDGGFWLNLLLR